MKTRRGMEEMGITHDTLYKQDVAMPYWLQFNDIAFLEAMSHGLRHQGGKIDAFLKFIYDNPVIANFTVSTESNLTVKDICEIIFRSTGNIYDMTDIMREYSQNLKKEPSDDTE